MDYQKASKKYDETYPNFLNTFTAEKTIKGAIGQSYDSIYDINPKAIKDCFGIIKSDFFCFKFEGVFLIIDDSWKVAIMPWYLDDIKQIEAYIAQIDAYRKRTHNRGYMEGMKSERTEIARYAALINRGENRF